jgi:hypothetical protein
MPKKQSAKIPKVKNPKSKFTIKTKDHPWVGALNLFVDKKGRILLMKRSKESYVYPNTWGLIGGYLDWEESGAEAAGRVGRGSRGAGGERGDRCYSRSRTFYGTLLQYLSSVSRHRNIPATLLKNNIRKTAPRAAGRVFGRKMVHARGSPKNRDGL